MSDLINTQREKRKTVRMMIQAANRITEASGFIRSVANLETEENNETSAKLSDAAEFEVDCMEDALAQLKYQIKYLRSLDKINEERKNS